MRMSYTAVPQWLPMFSVSVYDRSREHAQIPKQIVQRYFRIQSNSIQSQAIHSDPKRLNSE